MQPPPGAERIAFATAQATAVPAANPGASKPEVRWAELPSVSVDELLDLQQQVEFFLVLGQEEAARKLLAEHLRLTRGDFPLPHLQLMEVYQRRADSSAFEGARHRFQERFGMAWPDGNDGPLAPQHLEDAPDLLLDIERVWHDPAQAMAVLETLLRAADRIDSLNPTVQSDLLFLFTLARDLHDQPASVAGLAAGANAVPATPAAPAAPAPLAAAAMPAARPQTPAQAPQNVDIGVDVDVDFDLDLSLLADQPADLDLPLDVSADPPADLPAVALAPERGEFPRVGTSAQPVPALPVIDLPLAGAESGLSGLSGGRAAAAAARSSAAPSADALSLEFPDLELTGAAPAAAAEVDLELSFDEPEVAELPAPLSAAEERAASRFSLFSEEFAPAKKR